MRFKGCFTSKLHNDKDIFEVVKFLCSECLPLVSDI